jgi:L-cysteine:1D-myo-inositol 2-amino-2-deoxy-alpha-D-glucopyranoside ligase
MEVAQTSTVIDGVISALSDDLDTPKALELLDVWASNTESAKSSELIGSAGELSRALDSLLGLAL